MEQRTYNQYCATARTLDLIGERWTLLLIRELLTGPKRFGDLQASLRGLGTGLLAARLKHLEREGLARKITLPPPARTPAYALTEAGEELGPAVLALARWGLKWAMGERLASETFHPGWAVLGLRACFDAETAAGLHAVYEFRIDDEPFHARISDGTIEAVHGPAQNPDAVITITADAFVRLTGQGLTFADAVESGAASASGDGEALRRLTGLFRLPPPRTR
ncbi:transcriptional regulator [Actinoplanes lobatus]|uniref:Transcriptional regulator n=1 Tax=Actinoplanes lobatus TaxID=113568 RepID=A0A7W7HK77_9ACTN|nr:winged helix-turn-helix transcriptional regulator [Actinoplanes lobatus]MBB4752019.1 DNA-binding HxlR family transcriptional regulator [Actinoplanes lobatus]GGN85054.1 transcriptional regulator [Actinoplanes lobatus]GIE45349.1 transcriptional regulator [Actinoplanes lobatus]